MGGLLMGTDIHGRVEVRREFYTRPGQPWRGKRWVTLEEGIFTNPWFDPESTYAPFREQYACEPLSRRNYTLFALLANVRNGRGFAGVVTGDPIIPLSEPRGVPDDASHGWLAEVDSWDVDMHSHTWFTLAELLKPNPLYDQRLVRRGVIAGSAYEKLKAEGGTPQEWSGSITGAGIRTVTRDEYDAGERGETYSDEEIERMKAAWLKSGAERGETIESVNRRLTNYIAEGRTYVEYVWEDSLREATGDLHQMIAELKRYADDQKLDYADIRVVLGFDN